MPTRVLVTGAGSGIGRAVCVRVARDAAARGDAAKIAAVDLASSKGLAGVVDELKKLGAQTVPIHADMATTDGPGRAVADAVTQLGGLDGLVSNAGVNRPGLLKDYAVEDWNLLFDVNVRATWLLAKAAHAALVTAQGAIVVTASMSGSNAHANLGAYGPSKAAVIMLMRVLAQEFGRDGVRVNAVSPGMVRTGMTEPVYQNPELAKQRNELVPLGRVATPEDIADAIVFLLGRDARYVNGHDLVVDGGVAGNYLGRLPGLQQIPRG